LGLNHAARVRALAGTRLEALYLTTHDADLRNAMLRADNEAASCATAGYIAFGTSAALAGVAVWLWLRDDAIDDGGAALDLGAGSLEIMARF